MAKQLDREDFCRIYKQTASIASPRNTEDNEPITTTDIVDREGPRLDQLTREITTLTDIIARETHLSQTLQRELYLFQLEYQSLIAPYYLQKLSLDNAILKISTKIKSITGASNLLEELDYTPEPITDQKIQEETQYYSEKTQQSNAIHEKESTLNDKQKAELKSIYKKLMMQFHPDKFATDPVLLPLATALAQQINACYENYDLAGLIILAEQYKNGLSPDHIHILPTQTVDELLSRKVTLETHILDLQEESKKIRNTELYLMYKEYIRYQNVGKNFFQSLVDEIKQQIIVAKEVQAELEERLGALKIR